VQAFQRILFPPTDAFVTKYAADGRGLFSTLFGDIGGDAANGIVVDSLGNPTIVGVTRSILLPVTDDALQIFFGGGSTDGFVTTLSANFQLPLESTYLGGLGDDEAHGLAADLAGNLYVTGFTESDNFWAAEDAFQPERNGDADAFVSRFGFERVTPVSAASFAHRLAPDSIATAFGQGWSEGRFEAPAGEPLPFELGGVRVILTDSQGTQFPAPLIVVAPNQINFVVPDRIAAGPVTIVVTLEGNVVANGSSTIGTPVPALFSANADGRGVAAAQILRRSAQGDTIEFVFTLAPIGQRTPTPINLGPPSDEVFLVLFGTGLRNAPDLTVSLNGVPQDVLFFGAQGQFDGLDQINVRLSRNLIGTGPQNVVVTSEGLFSNTVTVQIQ
jgi:uncharacterized protein (TIGR03437 family)